MGFNRQPQVSEGEEIGSEGPGGAEGTSRPLRRDAERNRQRILRAAGEVFMQRGLDATLDDVARHAGVGVGTVYRRFPDKASLADALFQERIDALVALAEQAYTDPEPWPALVRFLERSAEMLSANRGLRQILMFAAAGHDRAAYARDRMRPAVGSLLRRAQAEGQVRDDLHATDVPVLEFMLGAITEYAGQVRPALWRRYLVLILDGLRPARDSFSPLPEPELSPDELLTAMQTNPVGRHLAAKPAQAQPPAGSP